MITARFPRSSARMTQALLIVCSVLLITLGLLGFVKADNLRSGPATQNDALVDRTATAEVQGELSQALTKVLSYSYSDPAVTEAAATKLLEGQAKQEYDSLFAALKKKAPDQKLTLTARVRAIGVTQLTASSAKALVFLDQSSTRSGEKTSTVAAAQLSITAKKTGGSWTITGLTPR